MNEPIFEFLPPTIAERPYTISEINEGISLILESTNTLVWIEGEISNWHVSSNGHCYFRLKDTESQIPAVLWRQTAAKLGFTPEDGLAILGIASIRVYRKSGYYQLDLHRMEPRGKGAQFVAFEQLKKKLAAEGLFDPAHKIALPLTVNRLGVVTSKRGAVVHDIVRVVASRAPHTDIVIADVPVQGDDAASKIVTAIRNIDLRDDVDCIVVCRGGGSAEDLRPFNEEIVARAIYDCETPIVSAIGHETDFTIADLVADVRAPTPSAAAEMVVPDRAERRTYFDSRAADFSGTAFRFFAEVNRRFEAAASNRALRLPLELVLERQQEFDACAGALHRRFGESLEKARLRFSGASSRLHAVSPLAVLSRGYSVVSDENGQSVRSSSQLALGQRVSMRFHKGAATASITAVDSPKNQRL